MKSILVSGGAGYIGSHMVNVLRERNIPVVVLDNLVTGHRQAVPAEVPFYQGDISDDRLIAEIIQTHDVDAAIHFAARSLVGESVAKPELYFQENTVKTTAFVDALLKNGVHHLVFSSTAAVYGNPDLVPISEDSTKAPINPYGFTKWTIEQSLAWLEQAHGLKWTALRYFNAAGAALDGSIGEHHEPETHLIPLVLQTALGQREAISVYGNDYNTPDGTCIRDYIHVLDLAEAHILALDSMRAGGPSGSFNVGTGSGYSVRDVIETAKRVTGRDIAVVDAPRRAGDPDELVAQVDKIKQALGWNARYSDLETIIKTAWNWHLHHPNGYSH